MSNSTDTWLRKSFKKSVNLLYDQIFRLPIGLENGCANLINYREHPKETNHSTNRTPWLPKIFKLTDERAWTHVSWWETSWHLLTTYESYRNTCHCLPASQEAPRKERAPFTSIKELWEVGCQGLGGEVRTAQWGWGLGWWKCLGTTLRMC